MSHKGGIGFPIMDTREIAENAYLLGLVLPFEFRLLGAIRRARLLPEHRSQSQRFDWCQIMHVRCTGASWTGCDGTSRQEYGSSNETYAPFLWHFTVERGPLFSSLVKKRRCGRPKKVPGAWNLRDV